MPFCAWCGNPVSAVSYTPCPRCGNPTNGSQRPATPAGGANTAGIVVAIIVGVFVVVAIIGILAAIAIPNMLTAMQRARQKRTMADLQTIATLVESYATDHNYYPKASNLSELEQELKPTYTKTIPQKDGWESDIRYECWSSTDTTTQCDQYGVASSASDKRFEHESLKDYPRGETTHFDCDIVFSNGAFVQYPERVISSRGGSR
jgi:type II secretory pathway pseudopilin PulG